MWIRTVLGGLFSSFTRWGRTLVGLFTSFPHQNSNKESRTKQWSRKQIFKKKLMFGVHQFTFFLTENFKRFESILSSCWQMPFAHCLTSVVLKGSGPQPFWHHGPDSWKTLFLWTGEGLVSGWFKHITSICILFLLVSKGFPKINNSSAGKESTCQCKRCALSNWVGKIPWSRKWKSTPVFLPEKFHWQRNLLGYSPWSLKESDTTEQLSMHTYTCIHQLDCRLSGIRA